MKTSKMIALIALLGCVMLFACNGDSKCSSIIGTYINHAGGTYSVADDTLSVQQMDGNNYTILRRTGFNLIREGKMGKREHETEEWNAIYNFENGTLTETRRGKIMVFQTDPAGLSIGKREYLKIN